MRTSKPPAVMKRDLKNAKLPLIFNEAVKALAACRTLDEAIYFDNKADALAAWAKIHKSDQAGREARALKLHAYRRMGILAEELQPTNRRQVARDHERGSQFLTGMRPGAAALLRSSGLSPAAANAAIAVSKASESQFADLISKERPPSPNNARNKLRLRGSAAFIHWKTGLGTPRGCLPFTRKHDPKLFASEFTQDEASTARESAVELMNWLDTFEQHLPKAKT